MISLYNYKLIELPDGRTILEGRLGCSTGPLWRTNVLKEVKKNYVITATGKLYHLASPSDTDDDGAESVASHFVDPQVQLTATGFNGPAPIGGHRTPNVTPILPDKIGSPAKFLNRRSIGNSTPLSRKGRGLLPNGNSGSFKMPAPVAARSFTAPVAARSLTAASCDLSQKYREKMETYIQMTHDLKEIEQDLTRIEAVAQRRDSLLSSVQSASVTEMMGRPATHKLIPRIEEEVIDDRATAEMALNSREALSIPSRQLSVERWLDNYTAESEGDAPFHEPSPDRAGNPVDEDESIVAASWQPERRKQNEIDSSDIETEFADLRKQNERRPGSRHSRNNAVELPRSDEAARGHTLQVSRSDSSVQVYTKQKLAKNAASQRSPRRKDLQTSRKDFSAASPPLGYPKQKSITKEPHRQSSKTRKEQAKSKKSPLAAVSMPPPINTEFMDDTLQFIGASNSTHDSNIMRKKDETTIKPKQSTKSTGQTRGSRADRPDSGYISRSSQRITLPESLDEPFWTDKEKAFYDDALLDVRADKFVCESDFWIAVSKIVKTKTWRECQQKFGQASRSQKNSERERRRVNRSETRSHERTIPQNNNSRPHDSSRITSQLDQRQHARSQRRRGKADPSPHTLESRSRLVDVTSDMSEDDTFQRSRRENGISQQLRSPPPQQSHHGKGRSSAHRARTRHDIEDSDGPSSFDVQQQQQHGSPREQPQRRSTAQQRGKDVELSVLSPRRSKLSPSDRNIKGDQSSTRKHRSRKVGNDQTQQYDTDKSSRQSGRRKKVILSDSAEEASDVSMGRVVSRSRRGDTKKVNSQQRSRIGSASESDEECQYNSDSKLLTRREHHKDRRATVERSKGVSSGRRTADREHWEETQRETGYRKDRRHQTENIDDSVDWGDDYEPVMDDGPLPRKHKLTTKNRKHQQVPADENVDPGGQIKLAGKKTLKRKEQLVDMVERINEGYSPGLFDSATPLAPNSKRYKVGNVQMTPLNINRRSTAVDSERRRLLSVQHNDQTTTGRDDQRKVRKESHKLLKSLRLEDEWPIRRSRERPRDAVSGNAAKQIGGKLAQRLLEEREAADYSSEATDSSLASPQHRAPLYYSDDE